MDFGMMKNNILNISVLTTPIVRSSQCLSGVTRFRLALTNACVCEGGGESRDAD